MALVADAPDARDDDGGAHCECLEETASAVPRAEVVHRKRALMCVQVHVLGEVREQRAGRVRGGEGDARVARHAREDRPVQRGRDHVPICAYTQSALRKHVRK